MGQYKAKEISIYNKSFIKGDLVEVFTEDKIIKCYIQKIKKNCILVEEIIHKKVLNIKLEDIENIFSIIL
ncbi:MAG: hypothetical protein KIC92_05870 [Clostridiales bacterium]|nr:hypothetical protein [Clostridiales bacterium]